MKYLLTLFALLIIVSSATGQRRDFGEMREEIKAQKIAFITKKLELTPDEAVAFWPLYNEYQDKEMELRPDFERPGRVSEELARQLLNQYFENEEKRLSLQKNYYNRFLDVLPARKVVRLHMVEREFKQKLLEKLKERREKRRGG
jgi:hypothetical protein